MTLSADQERTTDLRKYAHKIIIEDVLRQFPEARTSGLWTALKSLPDAEYVPEILTHDREWAAGVRFIPDAWLINAADRHVVAFEAIHCHDVPEDKFAKMVELSWALDEDYYRLILIRCDLTGRRAYDVQGAEMAMHFEQAPLNRGSLDMSIWQRYTVEYCARERAKKPHQQAVEEHLGIAPAASMPDLVDG